MIKKLIINNVGIFEELNQEKEFDYSDKKVNIILGFNGSGKTTISNAISLFSKNDFINPDIKKEIYNDISNQQSKIKLELQDTITLVYDYGKNKEKDFYVFNTNFISNHVYNGHTNNMEKMEDYPEKEISTPEIQKINSEIEEKKNNKNVLIKEQTTLQNKYNDIHKKYSEEFNKAMLYLTEHKKLPIKKLEDIKLIENEDINSLKTKIEKLFSDYKSSKNKTEIDDKKNKYKQDLEKLNFNTPNNIDINKINEILNKSINKPNNSNLNKQINFLKQISEINEQWFKQGKDILEIIKHNDNCNKCCPTCNKDITDILDNLLKEYNEYFDDTHENFISQIDQKINEIELYITDINKNYKKLEDIYYELCNIENKDIFNKKIIFKFNVSEKTTNLNNLIALLEEKKNDTARINNIEQKYKLEEQNIIEIKNKKKEILEELNIKTTFNKPEEIDGEIRKFYYELITLEFNNEQINNKSNNIERYNKVKTEISKTENEIEKLESGRKEEFKKFKKEVKYINEYLKKMSINNFEVDIKNKNIFIKYKVKEKLDFKNGLSEGEKNSLAFAYFLSKFKILNPQSKYVIVIDDPICSLDDNRIYSTAQLINKNFIADENCKQIIVLSHNLNFLKIFHRFNKQSNCLFLENSKLKQLPEQFKGFETPYFYMFKILNSFNENDKEYNYEKVKIYLPNYIRRILETFFSFKYAKIAKNGNNINFPGLNDFTEDLKKNLTNNSNEPIIKINYISEENLNKIIDCLDNIIKIANFHAHGSNDELSEENYISEDDLKNITKQTIEIIQTLDEKHLEYSTTKDELTI